MKPPLPIPHTHIILKKKTHQQYCSKRLPNHAYRSHRTFQGHQKTDQWASVQPTSSSLKLHQIFANLLSRGPPTTRPQMKNNLSLWSRHIIAIYLILDLFAPISPLLCLNLCLPACPVERSWEKFLFSVLLFASIVVFIPLYYYVVQICTFYMDIVFSCEEFL